MPTAKKSAAKKTSPTASSLAENGASYVKTPKEPVSTPTPVAATSAAAASPLPDPAAASSALNVVLIPLPPADANIPTPPQGFVATKGTDYRGITGKKSELAVLPQAIMELGRFVNWTGTFGKTAPSLSSLEQTLTAALQWSQMRNAIDLWDPFCQTMEGLAWIRARVLMEKLQTSFASAVETDSTIEEQNPSLAALLGAAAVIAQKGAETRKANSISVAKGEAPARGAAAAKTRKEAKIAAKVAAAQAALQGTANAAPQAQPATPTPAAQPAPAPPGATPPAGTNGVSH